ncbi:DUF883 domain-containing protein [Lichenihabitans sp. PAMC28606]|uniref:DUF883 family protein n=1 Tax=Lichenihabitans sp. PAMC28606 TaxID=2880932 RepID=UPI001D0BC4A7|nr:DUF883 domain-containing protein [Lichenihabitans sp. PAMC28606]UDL93889.1 DUF883 domain-containing protein [Lichenihabitans sp. PAMC28606]
MAGAGTHLRLERCSSVIGGPVFRGPGVALLYHRRGTIMADRGFEKVARDLSSDFSALRDDVRKLTNLVSDLASDQADTTRSSVKGAMDRARDRFSSTADRFTSQASDVADRFTSHASDVADRFTSQASDVGERVRGAGHEIESRIERNPMTAIMIAIVGGLLIGAMSRSRR